MTTTTTSANRKKASRKCRRSRRGRRKMMMMMMMMMATEITVIVNNHGRIDSSHRGRQLVLVMTKMSTVRPAVPDRHQLPSRALSQPSPFLGVSPPPPLTTRWRQVAKDAFLTSRPFPRRYGPVTTWRHSDVRTIDSSTSAPDKQMRIRWRNIGVIINQSTNQSSNSFIKANRH